MSLKICQWLPQRRPKLILGVICWRALFLLTLKPEDPQEKNMTENGVDTEGWRAKDRQPLYKLDPAGSSGWESQYPPLLTYAWWAGFLGLSPDHIPSAQSSKSMWPSSPNPTWCVCPCSESPSKDQPSHPSECDEEYKGRLRYDVTPFLNTPRTSSLSWQLCFYLFKDLL